VNAASALVRTAAPRSRGAVLVLRSCRIAQFEAAVRLARARHPEAEIVALSHPGHREALEAAGVDRILELPGRRFGLLRTSPWTLARLRREQFAEVVIPQISSIERHHLNLYWLVAALRCNAAVVVTPDRAPKILEGDAFRRYAVRMTASELLVSADVLMLLATLAASCVLRELRWMGGRPRRTGAKKRVLHVVSSLEVGGAQVQLAEVLNRTPRDEFEIELLVLGRIDEEFSRQWLARDDIAIASVEQWPRLMPSVLEIASRCRAGRYDLVHTWLFMANVVATAAARLAGAPRIVQSVRCQSLAKRREWYRLWWHRAADILASNAADVVTVNAQALVADHAQWAWTRRSRMQIVPNGLDPSRFLVDRRDARRRLLAETGSPEDAVLVGTVGRLAPEKDQATFLRILARVRQEQRDVRGVIVGDGPLRPELEALARALGVHGAIVFLGSRPDARRLIAGLDLFVLSSLTEGFPNVLLEATFLGVSCVATDVAGIPEILRHEVSLFPPGNDSVGASRVLWLLANPDRAASMQQFVRRRAMDLFTAERSVSAWLALYRRAFGAA
jgi:glycosyltransferase involved in cell wall biosynthesis